MVPKLRFVLPLHLHKPFYLLFRRLNHNSHIEMSITRNKSSTTELCFSIYKFFLATLSNIRKRNKKKNNFFSSALIGLHKLTENVVLVVI